jgi:hypothetical protein
VSVFCAQCCDVRYLCLFAYSGVQHISVLCFFFVFLCLVYSMLPVSLGCSGLLIFFFLFLCPFSFRYTDSDYPFVSSNSSYKTGCRIFFNI